MFLDGLINAANSGAQYISDLKDQMLKKAAVALLDKTLPIDVHMRYKFAKTKKQVNLNTLKLEKAGLVKSAKLLTHAGLQGEVTKGADKAIDKLDSKSDYLMGVDSVK